MVLISFWSTRSSLHFKSKHLIYQATETGCIGSGSCWRNLGCSHHSHCQYFTGEKKNDKFGDFIFLSDVDLWQRSGGTKKGGGGGGGGEKGGN